MEPYNGHLGLNSALDPSNPLFCYQMLDGIFATPPLDRRLQLNTGTAGQAPPIQETTSAVHQASMPVLRQASESSVSDREERQTNASDLFSAINIEYSDYERILEGPKVQPDANLGDRPIESFQFDFPDFKTYLKRTRRKKTTRQNGNAPSQVSVSPPSNQNYGAPSQVSAFPPSNQNYGAPSQVSASPSSNQDSDPKLSDQSPIDPELKKKQARRLRNRVLAQNARDRKKNQLAYLTQRVRELEEENQRLKEIIREKEIFSTGST